MRGILQNVLSGMTVPATLFSGTRPLDSTCEMRTAINFIAPGYWSSPSWNYFAGPDTTFAQVENWVDGLLGAGVHGGGHVANIFTDHGAGSVFWTSKGAKYDLSHPHLSPVNEKVRANLVGILNPTLQKIAIKYIGDQAVREDVLAIPAITFFPAENKDIAAQLLDAVIESAKSQRVTYVFMMTDLSTPRGLVEAVKSSPEWRFLEQFTLGKGNSSVEGLPEDDGPGWTGDTWLYGLGSGMACGREEI